MELREADVPLSADGDPLSAVEPSLSLEIFLVLVKVLDEIVHLDELAMELLREREGRLQLQGVAMAALSGCRFLDQRLREPAPMPEAKRRTNTDMFHTDFTRPKEPGERPSRLDDIPFLPAGAAADYHGAGISVESAVLRALPPTGPLLPKAGAALLATPATEVESAGEESHEPHGPLR